MSLNRKQQLDYTQKYQIRSGRVNFVDFIQRRELIQEGRLLGQNLYPPDHDQSIIPIIKEGEINTTPEELERYLAEVRLPQSSGAIPDPPTNLIGTSGDGQVTINFTPGNDNGSSIINYEYNFPDASGAGFEPFDPPTGPVASLTFTGLQNGLTYEIQIRAVNANGPSVATSSFFITPVPGGSSLILFLDGANGGSTSEWIDTSGKLKTATLYNTPTYSSNNGGYYILDGNGQYGQVPAGFSDFSNGITILSFVKFTGDGTTPPGGVQGWNRIIDFGTSEAQNNIVLARESTTTNLTIEVFNGSSSVISYDLNNAINIGSWGFYVTRIGGISPDGVLLRANTQSQSFDDDNLPANIERTLNYIGKSNWSADPTFEGNMGIVAIYDTALTDAQITAFFDLFKSRYFTVPGAPTSVSAVPDNASATVSFTAPVNDGGLPITSYTVTSSPGGITATGSSSPITVSGLTNGTSYTFRVVATNSIGNSVTSSASSPVTPIVINPPPAPISLSSVFGNQAAYILFTQSGDGGGAITNYEYCTDDGPFIAFSPPQTFSPVVINTLSSDGTTPLTNGNTYTIKLKAVNSAGSSTESESTTVTPNTTTLLTTNRIVYLDANNSSSYSGSGTNWANLDSGGSYSATLNGSPSYNTSDSSNKYFEFNSGTDTGQFAQINQAAAINPVLNTPFTIQIWVRINNIGSQGSLVSKVFGSPSFDGYALGYRADTTLQLHENGSSQVKYFTSPTNVLINGWALYTANIQFGNGGGRTNKIFVNGRQVVNQVSNETGIPSSNQNLTFPTGFYGEGECDIGAFYYYNTELTTTQIIQNFDATKSRYGY
jgi:hypothetical protein